MLHLYHIAFWDDELLLYALFEFLWLLVDIGHVCGEMAM
jgi:hypothetical protein